MATVIDIGTLITRISKPLTPTSTTKLQSMTGWTMSTVPSPTDLENHAVF